MIGGALLLSAAEQDIASRIVDGEAGGEPLEGKVAVAWVMRNRADFRHAWWGSTIGEVCNKPSQFSCLLPGKNRDRIMALDTQGDEYQSALGVVQAVMAGDVGDPTGGATTYKVTGTTAEWDDAVAGMVPRQIGKHSFWRLSPDGHCLPFTDQGQNHDGLHGTDGVTA